MSQGPEAFHLARVVKRTVTRCKQMEYRITAFAPFIYPVSESGATISTCLMRAPEARHIRSQYVISSACLRSILSLVSDAAESVLLSRD